MLVENIAIIFRISGRLIKLYLVVDILTAYNVCNRSKRLECVLFTLYFEISKMSLKLLLLSRVLLKLLLQQSFQRM